MEEEFSIPKEIKSLCNINESGYDFKSLVLKGNKPCWGFFLIALVKYSILDKNSLPVKNS